MVRDSVGTKATITITIIVVIVVIIPLSSAVYLFPSLRMLSMSLDRCISNPAYFEIH